MCNGDLFHPLEWLGASSNIVDGVENLCAVISHSTGITNAYDNFFENDETLFVLKGLTVHLLRTHGAIAALA
jgi:hypothetical protein